MGEDDMWFKDVCGVIFMANPHTTHNNVPIKQEDIATID